jgi:hypothetical protein
VSESISVGTHRSVEEVHRERLAASWVETELAATHVPRPPQQVAPPPVVGAGLFGGEVAVVVGAALGLALGGVEGGADFDDAEGLSELGLAVRLSWPVALLGVEAGLHAARATTTMEAEAGTSLRMKTWRMVLLECSQSRASLRARTP